VVGSSVNDELEYIWKEVEGSDHVSTRYCLIITKEWLKKQKKKFW